MRRFLRILRRTVVVLTVILVGSLIAVRAALPTLLRDVVEAQLSHVLHARVDVGSVELSLLGGRVGLRDVVVYPPHGSGVEVEPILGWKLFQAELDYEALRHKTIRVSEIVLDTPRVAVDRLADGGLNLQALAPTPATPPEATPVGTDMSSPSPNAAAPAVSPPPDSTPAAQGGLPEGWSMALDRFVLRGGGVRFRDLFVPQSQPMEIEIPAIEVKDVAFQAGRFDRPARLLLDVRSEGGSVKVEAEIRVEGQGLALAAALEAASLPLRRARVYVSGVGWSSFHGLADASLRYGLETGAKNELRGAITVRELEVKTPKLPHPALAWERLTVKLEPVDLMARSATIERIELRGAAIAATLRGGEILPVVAPDEQKGQGERRRTPIVTPAPVVSGERRAPPVTAEPAAKPWTWSLRQLRIDKSRFMVERPGRPLAIDFAFTTSDWGSRNLVRAAPAVPVTLGLKIGAGTIDTVGKLRLVPPAFGGTVRYARLDVRDVIPTSPSIPQRLVQSAILGGELVVEAGMGVRGETVKAPQSVRLRGRLSIDNLKVAAGDPKVFGAGWKRFDLRVDDAELPGALATSPSAAPQPIRVSIGSIRVEGPWANVTREAGGIVLPDLARGSAKPPPSPPARPSSSPPPEVSVGAAEIRGGRVSVVDRTVSPHFTGEITPIDLEARAIRMPGPSVGSFKLAATGFQGGKLDMAGALRADRSGTIDVSGSRIGLSPFNPYVTAKSSYGIGGGALSIHTKATFTQDRYDTANEVTIHQIALQGAQGDALFQQQFGISLATALALLTDLEGNIRLDVPVTVDKAGTQVDFASVIASALKAAVIGAALSPLKMLGAVAGGLGSDGEAPADPPPVQSVVGRADLSPEGIEQLGQVANLLTNRPAVGVNLVGVVSEGDLRFLAEQNLRVGLTKQTIDFEAVTGLFSRAARKRIVEALSDRAIGKPGELSEEDQGLLEELLKESPPATPEDRARLASRRVERVVAWLRTERNVDEKRLHAVTPPTVDAGSAVPGVRITLALPSG